MLIRVEEMKNYILEAVDGEIGRCKDFLFDDEQWIVRYMVADTGKWLPGRKVLISPGSLGTPRWSDGRLPVGATKEQIRNSPPLEIDKPVTQDYERRLYDYWTGPGIWGGYPMQPAPYAGVPRARGYYRTINPEARGLESAKEVTGFTIEASDGSIGHVEDFVIDDEDWAIRYMIVDTRNWLPGRKVLVSTQWLREVHWADAKVSVDMTRESIKGSPEYFPDKMNREYEMVLHRHYGFPPYWDAKQ
ncbi:MAG: PRC-barrel domain containing protein [Desulfobacteraceae bacterium]|nr:MAG: PRC-barrel domain containing protein [Desulfobacteraceae bacterium]